MFVPGNEGTAQPISRLDSSDTVQGRQIPNLELGARGTHKHFVMGGDGQGTDVVAVTGESYSRHIEH